MTRWRGARTIRFITPLSGSISSCANHAKAVDGSSAFCGLAFRCLRGEVVAWSCRRRAKQNFVEKHWYFLRNSKMGNRRYPGFGSEPQDVINRQIESDYDVFVGIFWLRAGTPTKNSASGSIEEFQKALERYRRDGSPEIMVYFKTAPINPEKIDLNQYTILKKFRDSISGEGACTQHSRINLASSLP